MDRMDAEWAEAADSRQNESMNAEYEEETLIQQFKRYFQFYRKTSDPDESFRTAFEALVYSVLNQISRYADAGDLESVRRLVRECDEIRHSIQGSNDSVKERFEREYINSRLQ